MNKLFSLCSALALVLVAVQAEDNVQCGLEPSEGCNAEELEEYQVEDEDEFGTEITLFYEEVQLNRDKFIDTFLNSECEPACESLGFSNGHKWQDLCENECSDFRSQVLQRQNAQEFHGGYGGQGGHGGGGCGCGGHAHHMEEEFEGHFDHQSDLENFEVGEGEDEGIRLEL